MTYSSLSEIGDRERNEDSIACIARESSHCFVVADGLGAHGKGEVASLIATETFAREFHLDIGNNKAFLSRAFDMAQSKIMSAKQCANEMKTTCVALSISGGKFAWGHVGDSRLYYFSKEKFVRRTLDHTVSQMLAISGEISDEDLCKHPDRNKLLRAMGDKWCVPRYELSKERRLTKGVAFLLCTDGFWEHLTNSAIIQALKFSNNAEQWLAALLVVVKNASNDFTVDNYSAIAVML